MLCEEGMFLQLAAAADYGFPLPQTQDPAQWSGPGPVHDDSPGLVMLESG